MKKLIFAAGILSLGLSITACSPSAVDKNSSDQGTTTTASSDTKKEKETTKAKTDTANVDPKFSAPGYAAGEIPAIPSVTLPAIGISESPNAKITLEMTSSISALPGVSVEPVHIENDQITRGESAVQVDKEVASQYSNASGDGQTQYTDDTAGITLQANSDGSGQYTNSKRGISLQVAADGSGQYTNNQKDMTIYIQGDHSAYTQGSIVIDNNGDGSGQYANQETGLTINNDGKGKATIQLGEEKITVDADPLEKPAKLPLLSSVSNAPSSLEANNLLITLNANILFDVDKYDVRQDAQTTLNNLANILKQANIAAFEINGYSDSDGSDEDNQTLSENYANSVKDYLTSQGITATIITHGYGKTRPVASTKTSEGKQANRRVEIVIPTN